MNAVEFFDELNAKTWRQNIESEVTTKVDSLLEYLQNNKKEIIDATIKDLEMFEKMKFEDKEEISYEIFTRWLNKLTKENISTQLGD